MTKFLKKFPVIIFVLTIFLILILSSCGANSSKGNLELTDLSGRTIKLDAPASKVAALSASDCEILCALEAQETIIARGTFCDYPESVKAIKDVGSGELTNLEELITLHPDVVLMSKMGFTLDQVNSMEAAGLKTLVNEANTFEDTYTYIMLLSKLVGKDHAGEKLVSDMRNSVEKLRNKAINNSQKTVYFQLCLPEHGYWTAGKNTFMNEMCEILNCKNIFDDVEGWSEVSKEEIMSRNPDITIRIDDDESFTRPGPRLIEALEKMYKLVYEA